MKARTGPLAGPNKGKIWPFQDEDGETDEAYQHPGMREAGTCNIFFDMDRSGGSLLKFDFNFGSNRTQGRYYRPDGNHTESVLFGNDLNRCRGSAANSMLACDPMFGTPCRDPATGQESMCSGNLMFTHHMINTVDLPWMDVDNTVGTRGQYTVKEPRYFTTDVEPGSSLVKSLVSAYMCFSGIANQPPRFMRNLEAIPNETDWLRVPGVTPMDYLQPEDTEITCTAGEPCIFPIYAQDFLLDTAGRSCITINDPYSQKPPYESCVFTAEEDESTRYQSTDVVRIEMAPGWETYDPLDNVIGEETEGADLVRAYCSEDSNGMGCVRDSDCPPGKGTCTGYKANDHVYMTQVRPGYCIPPKGSQSQSQILETSCRTDYDCRQFKSKCAVPSCESTAFISSKDDGAQTSSGGLGSLKCFYKEYFKPKHVGSIQTRCFVATDPQGDRYFDNETFFEDHPYHPRPWDGKCNNVGVTWRPGFQPGPQSPNGLEGYIRNPFFLGNGFLSHGCESHPPVHKHDEYARTCKSMPVCFKIKVEGKAPQFAEPTPLEANSYDDDGLLVEGRTDVPACEGYDLPLTIRAVDPDGDEVRIFVEDKDEDVAVASQLDKNLRGEAYLQEETYNLDFFNTSTMRFPAAALGNSQGDNFAPYAATREGDNYEQDTPLAFDPAGAKSVGTDYAPAVKYSHNATQRIRYRLDAAMRNGIIVRLADEGAQDDPQNCMVGDVNSTANDNRCRERLLNMDQTICAFAYDDSRYTSGRWVGKTDPNGKARQLCMETGRPLGTPHASSAKMYVKGNTDMPWMKQCSDDRLLPRWMRDHSNGDMASPMHCWRIRLQAPPIFVTDPKKISTPFPADYPLSEFDGNIQSTPDGATLPQTPRIVVRVEEQLSWTFVAQDPNPGDSVSILILDDPGLPPEMRAGETICIRREGAHDMFAAADQGWKSLPSKMEGKSSACSKAKLQLDWIVPASVAGRTFQVCVVAQDDSGSCAGIAHPERATTRGWFGEVQCVEFVVSKPIVRFDLQIQPQEMIHSYVGCTTQIELFAVDCSQSLQPCVGHYRVQIQNTTDLPEGAYLTQAEVEVGRTRQLFKWIPQRGMEGYEMQVCFTAVDQMETQTPTAPVCFKMMVQKCQYCIGPKDTLSLMMKDYGLDTNWLRLWLHNGNNAPTEDKARIENPDLIVKTHEVTSLDERMGNSLGQPIVWAGLVYKTGVGESLATVAERFRTTIAGLLAVNPDVLMEGDIPSKVDTLCVVPCGQRYADSPRAAL